MANEPIQGGPYPEPIDPPDGPGQMSAIVGWAAGRSVMRFASIAARDAALPIPVDGMLCYVTSDKTYYGRSGGQWHALWSEGTWVDVVPTEPFGHGTARGQVRLVGRLVEFKGGIGGTLAANTTTVIARVPLAYRPPDGTRTITSGAATQGTAVYYMNVETNGDVRVRVATAGTYNVALGALRYSLD